MLTSRLREGRRSIGAVVVVLLGGVLAAVPASAELGWEPGDYVQHVGPASAAAATPEQVRFTTPHGANVLVVFASGHSREELWAVGEAADGIPAELLKQAQAALQGTPARRISFRLEHTPAAEIFETRSDAVVLQIDVRGGRLMRIDRCRGPAPCVLLDQLLAMERATDDLMARAEQQLRQQTK